MPSEVKTRPTGSAAPSQTTTKAKDVLKLCKWAKKNGAVQIKVDGVEILFPPPELQPEPQVSKLVAAYEEPTRPNYPWLREEQLSVGNPPPATVKPRPAINSEGDHPDVYAQKLDEWANQRPLGRR